MQAALKLIARVLPGKRIEIVAPELIEGEDVELIVLRAESATSPSQPQGVWDYIQSLPPVQRTPEEWAEIEREFQEERDSWDR